MARILFAVGRVLFHAAAMVVMVLRPLAVVTV